MLIHVIKLTDVRSETVVSVVAVVAVVAIRFTWLRTLDCHELC